MRFWISLTRIHNAKINADVARNASGRPRNIKYFSFGGYKW